MRPVTEDLDPELEERRAMLQAFARVHGLRPDWHEPDEQEVGAVIEGGRLDNAQMEAEGSGEYVVVLTVEGLAALRVNLATLLALACAPAPVADGRSAERPDTTVSPDGPMRRWVVARWRHDNVGGESLVLGMDDAKVVFATGPTPWGSGSWGPFPVSAVISTRPLTLADSWPHSGCPSARWTAEDLLGALQRSRCGTLRQPSEAEITLTGVVRRLRAAAPQGDPPPR